MTKGKEGFSALLATLGGKNCDYSIHSQVGGSQAGGTALL